MTLLISLKTLRHRLDQFTLRDERGTQLVELAIVLPVIILFFAATAEFGRFFYTYSTLAKAARAGARYAISRPFDSASLGQAKSLAAFGDQSGGCSGTPVIPNLQCANVDIQPSTVSGVQVVTAKIVNFQYQPLFDLGKLTGNTNVSLKIDVNPSVSMKYIY
ncbi:MAG: pilus assembly protein [Acidobacteria bacterium]|nr:pilus assembly protein [Acidobacteriota bacterium]